MDRKDLIKLLVKELDYQVSIFGRYSDDPNLNLASLILLIEEYLTKAKKAYSTKWTHSHPDWLLATNENKDLLSSSPDKAYEELIKVFALSGAALEAFTAINPDLWRDNGIKDKWNIGGNNIGR